MFWNERDFFSSLCFGKFEKKKKNEILCGLFLFVRREKIIYGEIEKKRDLGLLDFGFNGKKK